MITQYDRDRATLDRRPSRARQLAGVERLALVAGIVVLGALAVATLVPAARARLQLTTTPVGPLVAAAAVYALGHLLRGLRLAVLLNDPVVGARRILAVHLLTAGLSLLLPFKLGDLVRMRITGVLVASTARGVVATVLERSLDVGVVLAIAVVATATSDEVVGLVTPLLVLSGAFVVATVAAVTVVPDYLRALSLYLVRRPAAPGGLRLLAGVERVMVVLDEVPRLLRRRTPTLVVLTGLVWSAELGALALALPALGGDLVRLSGALATFLSSLSSGAIALFPGGSEQALGTWPPGDMLEGLAFEQYRTVLLVPLLWASVAAGVALRTRLLTPLRRARRRPTW